MKNEKLLHVIGDIDDDLIYAAGIDTPKKNNHVWKKWIPIAACLCLIVGGVFVWNLIKSGGPANSTSDMLAFFIYDGNTYVQYSRLNDTSLKGSYLGTSTGEIDEWTSPKDYKDFSGSISGDFYTVNGIDSSFMLCIQTDADTLSTYINDNITMYEKGADLYEDMFHLTDNFTSMSYETSDSYYQSKGEILTLTGEDIIYDNFINQLYQAEFQKWDEVVSREDYTSSSIYETELYHLYLHLENGMAIHLRLYENGYVRFEGLMDICLQIPEESFQFLRP